LVRVGEAHFALAGAKCWAWLSEPSRIVALALRVSFRKAGVIRSALNRGFILTAGAMRYASNIIVPCGSYSGRVLCEARLSRAVTFALFAARPVMFPVLRPFGGIATERRYAFSEQRLFAFLPGLRLIVGVGLNVRIAVDFIEQGNQRLDGPFNVAASAARDFNKKAGLGHFRAPLRASARTSAA
jgi:hypothetical protein